MAEITGTIADVSIRSLRRMVDDRGWLMEIFRSDWPEFQKFGQTYMTTCKPGVIKAWHYHKLQWDHFVPIKGNALIGLYDSREGSPTKGTIQEVEVWEDEPKFVKIPPLVYHGFTPLDDKEIWVINTPTELYNYKEPDEHRKEWNDPAIGYNWRREV
ncbi:MAG: dTDP-4-dehydrorhamnose 3,5-epimerase family protein [Thermoplasmata archaeon]|nr:dTDP-4-dehydrorhamnose 3,5-epimerase family protein [Thermoplasmata archaeon]